MEMLEKLYSIIAKLELRMFKLMNFIRVTQLKQNLHSI